jgi:hypothetical protein
MEIVDWLAGKRLAAQVHSIDFPSFLLFFDRLLCNPCVWQPREKFR